MFTEAPWYGDNVVRAVTWLQNNPGAHTGPEVAAGAKIPPRNVHMYLRRALKYGYVENPSRGKYVATPGEPEVRVNRG
jgi:hypothetical protein